MSRGAALMTVITSEPASTSELYDRVGYPTLARLGLIPYRAFRAELAALAAAGSIESESRPDGSAIWRLARPDEPAPGSEDSPRSGHIIE